MADSLTPITSDQLSKVTTAQDTDLVTLGINGNFVTMALGDLKNVLGITELNTKMEWKQLSVGTEITIPGTIDQYREFKFIIGYNNNLIGEFTLPAISNFDVQRTIYVTGWYNSDSNFASVCMYQSGITFSCKSELYLVNINGSYVNATIVLYGR